MMRTAKIPLAVALTISLVACQRPTDREAVVEREEVPVARYGPAVQGLQMKARPLRRVAPAGELLLVEITVRNLADSIVRFHPMIMIGANLRAEIVGPDGLPVPLTASIDAPSALNAGTVWLRPGETIADTVDLNCVFPAPERESCIAPYDLSRSGEYRIELGLHLPLETERRGNIVPLEAEPFTVRVEEDHRTEDTGGSPDDLHGVGGCYQTRLDTSGAPLPKWDVVGIPNPFELPRTIRLTPHLKDLAGTWHFTVLPSARSKDVPPPRMGAFLEAGSDSLLFSTVNGVAGLRGTFRGLDTDTLVGTLRVWTDDDPYSQREPWPAMLIRVDCVTGRPVRKPKDPLYWR